MFTATFKSQHPSSLLRVIAFSFSVLVMAGLAGDAHADGVFGTSDGTLYRYNADTQTVTPISSGWGNFEQIVGLNDGRVLFGSTASAGTLAVATTANASVLATGMGTFEQMTAIRSGTGAVYGTSMNGGTVGGFDGMVHTAGQSGLTAGGGYFSAIGDLGDGNVLIGTNGGSANGNLLKVSNTGATLLDAGGGWVAINQIAGLPNNDDAVIATSFNDGLYYWNDDPSWIGGGITAGWQGVQQLVAVSETHALMGAGWNNGTVTTRNASNASTVTESGWVGFELAVSLPNGDALVGTSYNNGSPMLYDADAGDGDTYGVGGGNWGTFQQMIALDNGYAVFGTSGLGSIDGEYLGLWDGSGISYTSNGGLGWGNFEMMFELENGELLVGTDANGGTLYLVDTSSGTLMATVLDTGLGSFQGGSFAVAVAAVPEPTAMAAWLIGFALIGLVRRRVRKA